MVNLIKNIIAFVLVVILLPTWLTYCTFLFLTCGLIRIILPYRINTIPANDYVKNSKTITLCRILYDYKFFSEAQFEYERNIYLSAEAEAIIGYRYLVFLPSLVLTYNRYACMVTVFIIKHTWFNALKKTSLENLLLYKIAKIVGESILIQKTFMIYLSRINVFQLYPFIIINLFSSLIFFDYVQYGIYVFLAHTLWLIYIESLANGLDVVRKNYNIPILIITILSLIVFYTVYLYYSIFNIDGIVEIFHLLALGVFPLIFSFVFLHELDDISTKTKGNHIINILYYVISIIPFYFFFKETHNIHHQTLIKNNDKLVAKEKEHCFRYIFYHSVFLFKRLKMASPKKFIIQMILFSIYYICLFMIDDFNLLLLIALTSLITYGSYYTINYVQHYSLNNEKMSDRCWDTKNLFTNDIYFHLGEHSSHHFNISDKNLCSNHIIHLGYCTQIYILLLFTKYYHYYIDMHMKRKMEVI